MPTCEICGMEAPILYECECGAKFCEECGDPKRKLCYDCLGWGDEEGDKWSEKEDYWEDEEEIDEDWDEEDYEDEDWNDEDLN
ncbi:MAG: hypothetical protein ACUVV4_03660 [Candidatus Bathyarchaeia archaeon]